MLTYKRNLTIIRPMPFGVALKVQVEGPTSGATEVSSLQLALEVEPKSQTPIPRYENATRYCLPGTRKTSPSNKADFMAIRWTIILVDIGCSIAPGSLDRT